jgi:hypothetical protein
MFNGYDTPLIGPVLRFITNSAPSTADVSVTPTGNSITVSVGSVSLPKSVFVTGNTFTVSVGTVAISNSVFPAGNVISVLAGNVAVASGNNASVGVGGQSISVSVGTVTVTANANVTPATNQIDIIVGLAAVAHSTTVSPSGNVITLNSGAVTVSNVVAVGRSWNRSTVNLHATINDLVVEDDYDLVRTIAGIPTNATITSAWLTIKTLANKNAPDSAAVIQKIITTAPVSGAGQITDEGVSGTGEVLFQFTASETALFEAGRWYVYDIQCLSSSGKLSTREKGTLVPIQQVTQYP